MTICKPAYSRSAIQSVTTMPLSRPGGGEIQVEEGKGVGDVCSPEPGLKSVPLFSVQIFS